MSDERNFRSAYYEKVGCKNVEERKSLEILLKEKVLDRVKLKQFCVRYNVPSAFRSLVWNICLGVLPVHTECHAFIVDQRKQEYNDLVRALNVMKIVDNNTPKPKVLYAAFLLQSNALKFETSFQTSRGFCEIVQFLMPYYKEDAELYWLAKGFYYCVHSFDHDLPKLIEAVSNLLEKEEPIVYKHLKAKEALDNLPYESCFESCYAKIMNYPTLAKIWDKLAGGSCSIFVYVFLCLLMHLKHSILKCMTQKKYSNV
ncbi:hypothetical protein HHI36_007843 [Cryptolaemus montrouzieri]|uniref:TBC1 domain family member 7 n=1 Tax=Cryptolaemus montrouzieri TaxID=559131 RepID=A0ABD2MQM6_9CUCU